MKSLYNKQHCESYLTRAMMMQWFITGIMKEPNENYFALPHLCDERKRTSPVSVTLSKSVCLSVVKLGYKVCCADHCHLIWSIFIRLLSFICVQIKITQNKHKYPCHTMLCMTFWKSNWTAWSQSNINIWYAVHFKIWDIYIHVLISVNWGNGEVIPARTQATSKSKINWDREKLKIVSAAPFFAFSFYNYTASASSTFRSFTKSFPGLTLQTQYKGI